MSPGARALALVMGLAGLLSFATAARSDDLPEYRLKAAFVYNFIVYTEWPAATGSTLNLCILGTDPFGKEIDGLQGKVAASRTIAVQRKATGESLKDCHVVFFAASVIDSLPRLLDNLRGRAVLTLADSAGAMRRGVMLNMNMAHGKVTFEANLQAARGAGLDLSSKLLRLATEVQQ
ncbi:MAG: YfiR family protein [Rubrivivax sp.]|nr:YfiR family protein [Rubrivivax sp.]